MEDIKTGKKQEAEKDIDKETKQYSNSISAKHAGWTGTRSPPPRKGKATIYYQTIYLVRFYT